MRLWRRKREPKPDVPKVWVRLYGMPFYVPVTDPYVELAYGRKGAERLRRELLGEKVT